ncbi:MAG: hypothetical protein RQ735_11340 [Flavobacteriaceae bacterium]|nr:hypothetical protein [Flavobacteriaceae bacterium]
MKNVFYLIAIFSVFSLYGQAQDLPLSLKLNNGMVVNPGDVFVIGDTNAHHSFTYLNVGKSNFIIKKGGIYNPKSLSGLEVVVSDIQSSSKGDLIVLRRADGNLFLGANKLAYIRDLEKALASGELLVKKSS